MTFYIALTPPLLAAAYMLLKLRALTKHDKVLYAFCDVRRDVMSVLRKHAFDLTKEDYIALREIEQVTSATIHDYHICKIYLFNFRKFRAAVRRLEGIEVHVHQGLVLPHEIVRLKNNYRRALLFAFFTFTPFLQSEIMLTALHGTVAPLAKLGWAKANKLLKMLSHVEDEKRALNYS